MASTRCARASRGCCRARATRCLLYTSNARLSAQLNVNNLFDKKYYLGGVANQVYYGEPRSVFLNLKATF